MTCEFSHCIPSGQNGLDVTDVQNTPISTVRHDTHILFGVDVYLQKPIEFLPPGKNI